MTHEPGGPTVRLTGLPASGKATIGLAAAERLRIAGWKTLPTWRETGFVEGSPPARASTSAAGAGSDGCAAFVGGMLAQAGQLLLPQ